VALVLVEHEAGVPDDASLQALALARELDPGSVLDALLLGADGAAAADTLGRHGVATAHVAEHEALTGFAPDAWARVLVDLAERSGATVVAAAGSERGNEVMARAAARLDEPLATNVIEASGSGPWTVTRVRWGGSLLEEARLDADRALLTIQPHAVTAVAMGDGAASVAAFTPQLDSGDLVVRASERVGAPTGGVSLADAKVVVSAGRGAGSTEGFAGVEELAALLGGAVGCSRAVTMAGWRPHTDQVGQTGTKIAPDLYIACGISGATQHMAGCKGAKAILAVNSDPEAPILSSADYAVIGDLHEVVPAICAAIREARAS